MGLNWNDIASDIADAGCEDRITDEAVEVYHEGELLGSVWATGDTFVFRRATNGHGTFVRYKGHMSAVLREEIRRCM